MLVRLAVVAVLVALGAAVAGAQGTVPQSVGPYTIAKQGYFFVGGHYVDQPGGQLMAGQAYVEYQIPQKRTHPFPIVMIEGCCTSGAGFNGTPDGRDGWEQYFVANGWAVYIMDQVGRGRSQYLESVYGKNNPKLAKADERDFIAYEKYNLFPQAHLHTQWPGTGTVGDPLYDQFYAAQLPDFQDRTLREVVNTVAGIALLDKIGPAILMPHSQAGLYVWPIADRRPNLVKGIVAIEAGGTVFHDVEFTGPPTWFKDGALSKPYGLTRTPITFSPAITDPSQIAIVQQDKPDAPDLVRCWMQKEPARTLPNLREIAILSIVSEASFAAPDEHCGAKFLTQAGVPNTFIRLPDIGIHGNGHFMMLEKNNLQIAGVIADWLRKKGL
jgi:pimeloyl-ACP methyl ester carboxylesterase